MNLGKKLLKIILLNLIFLCGFYHNFGMATTPKTAIAIFASGCFWCTQADFDAVKGVLDTKAGYINGHVKHPTYEQVSSGQTGHYEAVQVTYDPSRVSYQQLLDVFWHNVDPVDANGQFCDRGKQYRSAIFYSNDNQKQLALNSRKALIQSGHFKQIATNILPATTFYMAEIDHQKYYQKNPVRYQFYRYTCGRDARLQQIWDNKLAHE